MSFNIDDILDVGNALISSAQGLMDMSQPQAGTNQANTLVSVAGVVAGILNSEAGHQFAKSLAGATNFNVAVLAVATNGMQLADAIKAYDAAPVNNRDAEYRNMADKLFGTIGAIGAAVATIPLPQTRTLGLTAWGLATLLQHTFNGNIGNMLTYMGEEMWNTFSSVLASQQGQTWTADLGAQRAISGSVLGEDWRNPGWQGTDRTIVIAWHEFDAQGRSVSYRSTISVATAASLAEIMRNGATDYQVEGAGQRPNESFTNYVDRVNSGLTSMGGGGWQTWNGEIDTGGGNGGGGSRNKLEQFAGDDPDYGLSRGGFRSAAPSLEVMNSAISSDKQAAAMIEAMAAFDTGAGTLGVAITPRAHDPMLLAAV